GSSSFAPPPEVGGGAVEPVETTTLDAVTANEDRTRIRLVKLDLEGAEYAALQAAQSLLQEVQPDFLVELEPEHLARQGTSVADVIGLFEKHGYRFFTVDGNGQGSVLLTPITHPGEGGARPNLFMCRNLERLARAPIVLKES